MRGTQTISAIGGAMSTIATRGSLATLDSAIGNVGALASASAPRLLYTAHSAFRASDQTSASSSRLDSVKMLRLGGQRRGFSSTGVSLAAPPQKKKAAGPRKKSSVKGVSKGAQGALNVMREIRDVDEQFTVAPNDWDSVPLTTAANYRENEVGKVFRTSLNLFRDVPKALPKTLYKTSITDLARSFTNPPLVMRKAALDLIAEVNNQLELTVELKRHVDHLEEIKKKAGGGKMTGDVLKEHSESFVKYYQKLPLAKRPILVGPSGVGKTSLLLEVVDYFRANKWIVLYFSNTHEWIDATAAFVKNGDLWDQPVLISKVMDRIRVLANRQLGNIPIAKTHQIGATKLESGTLGDIALGYQGRAASPPAFKALMEELLDESRPRPPVLLAIDGVNSLFTETEYRDTESNRLRGDQLTLINSLLKFFVGRPKLNTVVIGAMDSTESVSRSPYLEQKLGLRPVPFIGVSKKGVVLPDEVVPTLASPLAQSPVYQGVRNLAPWTVYPYDRKEAEAMIKFYEDRNLLHLDENVPRDVQVSKLIAMSGGNPMKLFKLASMSRSPGSTLSTKERALAKTKA